MIEKETTDLLNEAISKYVAGFCDKHELEFDYWVADLTGTIGVFGDYFFNFEDIRLDLEKDVPDGKIFEWYDNSLELGMEGKHAINYYTWIKANISPTNNVIRKIKVKMLLSNLREIGYHRRFNGSCTSTTEKLKCDCCQKPVHTKIGYEKDFPKNPDIGLCFSCSDELSELYSNEPPNF